MLWEAHITVADEDVERWCAYCAERSAYYGTEVKPLYIELTTGEYPRQLMFAHRWEGEPGVARDRLDDMAWDVKQEGFVILREKLECPLDKALILAASDRAYSECHMKLMIPANEARSLVDETCAHAHVSASRNLLADRGGLQKWYLTERDYSALPRHAARTFNRTLSRVQELAPAFRMEMECVTHDSNPGLDEGWAGVPPSGTGNQVAGRREQS